MKKFAILALSAPLFVLAACGGKGDDKLGEQVQEAAENSADNAVANGTMTEGQAEAVKDAAEVKEEKIDDADVNADALSNEQKAAVVNGN
jgi:protein involved in sex pheromone biosynthesis